MTLVSASKGWNLPGLKCAQMILTNEADMRRWKAVPAIRSHGASTFGIRASLAAYRDGEEWLDELLVYLDTNRRLLGDLLADTLPEVGYAVPQATYLAWLDFSAMNFEGEAAEVIRREARVATNPGSPFRGDGPGHVRLNFATSKSILTSAVHAIAEAFH